jgi:hypothetical protein
VHVLCPAAHQDEVTDRLKEVEGVTRVLTAHPGGPARALSEDRPPSAEA